MLSLVRLWKVIKVKLFCFLYVFSWISCKTIFTFPLWSEPSQDFRGFLPPEFIKSSPWSHLHRIISSEGPPFHEWIHPRAPAQQGKKVNRGSTRLSAACCLRTATVPTTSREARLPSCQSWHNSPWRAATFQLAVHPSPLYFQASLPLVFIFRGRTSGVNGSVATHKILPKIQRVFSSRLFRVWWD